MHFLIGDKHVCVCLITKWYSNYSCKVVQDSSACFYFTYKILMIKICFMVYDPFILSNDIFILFSAYQQCWLYSSCWDRGHSPPSEPQSLILLQNSCIDISDVIDFEVWNTMHILCLSSVSLYWYLFLMICYPGVCSKEAFCWWVPEKNGRDVWMCIIYC